MTMVDPIPDVQWGRGNWQDYISNWREKDAEWMQERVILRYPTTALRTADWATPRAGQVTFNGEGNNLEMWHPTKNSWVRALMYANLTSTQDTGGGANISHVGAGGRGITFMPGGVSIDNPVNMMTGVLTVDAGGVNVRTGARTVRLTTGATDLISDSPITAPSITLNGTGTVLSAPTRGITVGSITATSATIPDITMSGTLTAGTVSGNIVNGTSGTIGGVALASNAAVASGGFFSQNGGFYGDGTSALMRRRISPGVFGNAFVQVAQDDVWIQGGYLRVTGGRGIPWHNAGGTHQAWISPSLYSATDPGAANFPDGTIWVN